MVNIDRILCPIDLSAFSHHALRHALALAAARPSADNHPACVQCSSFAAHALGGYGHTTSGANSG